MFSYKRPYIGKEPHMMEHFEVIWARIFLELGEIDDIMRGMTSFEDLHPSGAVGWFCRAADRELKLNGLLNRYVESNPNLPIESISRLGWDERDAFFSKQTHSPWDCCRIDRKSLDFKEGTANLLVEYALAKSLQINEEDRQSIYFECRKLYAPGLLKYKTEHPDHSEGQAVEDVLADVSVKMMKEFGVPYEMLVGILKEGHEKWQTFLHSTDSLPRFSLSHCPRNPTLIGTYQGIGAKPHSKELIINRINENMRGRQYSIPYEKTAMPKVSWHPVEVKRNITGVEDAIDLEYELWKEEIQKNKTQKRNDE
jgi:hypothetical protein